MPSQDQITSKPQYVGYAGLGGEVNAYLETMTKLGVADPRENEKAGQAFKEIKAAYDGKPMEAMERKDGLAQAAADFANGKISLQKLDSAIEASKKLPDGNPLSLPMAVASPPTATVAPKVEAPGPHYNGYMGLGGEVNAYLETMTKLGVADPRENEKAGQAFKEIKAAYDGKPMEAMERKDGLAQAAADFANGKISLQKLDSAIEASKKLPDGNPLSLPEGKASPPPAPANAPKLLRESFEQTAGQPEIRALRPVWRTAELTLPAMPLCTTFEQHAGAPDVKTIRPAIAEPQTRPSNIADIKTLQTALGVKPDGVMSTQTNAALEKFLVQAQMSDAYKAQGGHVDAIYGEKTEAALQSLRVDPAAVGVLKRLNENGVLADHYQPPNSLRETMAAVHAEGSAFSIKPPALITSPAPAFEATPVAKAAAMRVA